MKIFLTLLLFTVGFSICKAQTRQQLESGMNAKKTGDDKQNFSGILNALGQFTSQDEATIRFQPTLYGLVSLFKPGIKKQDKFSKAALLRNFQLNLGATPSDESIFDVDDFQSGFTYAILNNKKLKSDDYDKLKNSQQVKNLEKYISALGVYAAKHPGTAKGKLALSYATEGIKKEDIDGIPQDMLDFLKPALGISDANDLINFSGGAKEEFKKMTTKLSKRTLLTVDFNSTYSFEKKEWNEFTFTPFNLIKYFNKDSLKSPGLNLKLKYSIGEDTAVKEKLKRNWYVAEAGINFPVCVNKKTEKINFEIKPGIKYTYIANRLYKDERQSQFNPTVTFRLRINDDFYLPLVLEYNTEDPELLGFLSLQFSLN